MKTLLINVVCGINSTGRICTDIATELEQMGFEVKIGYGRGTVPEQYKKYAVRIGNDIDTTLHAVRTRLFDQHGLGSKHATKRFLKWADEYDPDLLWLHNIHGYYINYELLFKWVKSRPNMLIKWTLHDCWAFTGHCAYFTMAKCEQWKTKCLHCPQKHRYPASILIDNCKHSYICKKEAFTGLRNLTLITPSKWLADLVKQSFLKDYPIKVRYNTIDTSVFTPTPSNFRERYQLSDKKIILGVASVWDERKRLDDYIKLSNMLDDEYVIVLVGLTKKQITKMPPSILGLQRTDSVSDLVKIYSAADCLLSLSREETFGMTILEAFKCGTESIVLKNTACEEVVEMLSCGIVVDNNLESVVNAIRATCQKSSILRKS